MSRGFGGYVSSTEVKTNIGYQSSTTTNKRAAAKATGGDITFVTAGGQLQAVHTFNDSGTFTPLEAIDVEYLVIGGCCMMCSGLAWMPTA